MDDKLAFPGRLGQPDLALPFDSRLDPRLRQAFLAIPDATETMQNAGVDGNSSYEDCLAHCAMMELSLIHISEPTRPR